MVIEPTPNTPKRILVLAEPVAAYFPRQVPGVLELKWRKSRPKVYHAAMYKRLGVQSGASDAPTGCHSGHHQAGAYGPRLGWRHPCLR
jgi:hypothetical protein